MTYYEQVRFLHFFLTTHTFVCLENCFSQPNIPEHQLIDCFEQVLFSTFFREKDHGGKHEQRTSYGCPGKVSCISIVTDRTLSAFRASYSATEQESIREMTFNFCFRLLEAIGIFRHRIRQMTARKALSEIVSMLEWIDQMLLEVTRSPECRSWNQAQEKPNVNYLPICGSVTCNLI